MPSVTLNISDAVATRVTAALVPYSAFPENPVTPKVYLIDCLRKLVHEHESREAEAVRQAADENIDIT